MSQDYTVEQLQPMSAQRDSDRESRRHVSATLSSEHLDNEHGPVSPLLSPSSGPWHASEHTAAVEMRSIPHSLDSSGQSTHTVSVAKASIAHKVSRKTSWPKVWLWEILAAVFSLLCMGAVIAVLAYMDDKLLDDWHFPISPNALVSVFMTLAKSAMLLIVAEGISQFKWIYYQNGAHRLYDMLHFDNASRGPWGAAQLVWAVRWNAIVASAGALITIVALAMDPFTQQVIAYQTTMRNVTGVTAMLRNARSYDDQLPNVSSMTDTRGDYDMQLNVTAAIFSGVSQSTTQVAFTCGTGNCTWPLIETLGACSSCKNLTGIVKPKCSTPTYTETCNITYGGLFVQASNKESQPGPQWTVSDLTLLNISADYPGIWDNSFHGSLDTFLAVLPDSSTSNEDFPSSINTYTCDLSLCRKQYNSTVNNGVLSESLVSITPLTFPLCGLSGSLDSEGNTWMNPTTKIEVCPGFPTDQVPSSMDPANKTAMLTDPNIVWINAAMISEMSVFLRDLMSNQSTSTSTAGTGAYSVDKALANMLYHANSGDFIKTMDDITLSLSNQIRHGPNATWADGFAQVPTTKLIVLWAWLSLPLALILLSVVFLAFAIAFSSEPSRFVWKSSILATIFHRVEGVSVQELDKRNLEEMEESARGMQIRLGTDLDGNVSLCRQPDVVPINAGVPKTGLSQRLLR